MNNEDMPAKHERFYTGLTKRERFAMAAMGRLAGKPTGLTVGEVGDMLGKAYKDLTDDDFEKVEAMFCAQKSLRFADALLAALEQE